MRALPHSLDAEVAVLGACLLSKAAHAEVVDRLDEAMFFQPAHRTLFAALVRLAEQDVPADPVTVADVLETDGRLEEVGGPAAVHDLMVATPSAANVSAYCTTVERAWRARQVIASAGRLAEAAREQWRDGLDEAIDETVESWTSSGGDDGLLTVDDLVPALKRRLDGQDPIETWSTGWPEVDRVYRVPKGLLTVVTGIPGSGKSTWVDCTVTNILRADKTVKVAMFSPEQAPADQHLLNLLHSGIGTDPVRADRSTVEYGLNRLRDRVVWLDDQRDNTVSGVLARARMAVRKHGCQLLVVDPWNKLRHDRSRHHRDDLYVQEALGRFTRFARKEQVAVILVAHPKIMEREPNSATRVRPPGAYSISGGSEWDNQADAIVTVHRDKQGEVERSTLVQVIVSKVRFEGRFGHVGAVELEFDPKQRRYGPVRSQAEGSVTREVA